MENLEEVVLTITLGYMNFKSQIFGLKNELEMHRKMDLNSMK